MMTAPFIRKWIGLIRPLFPKNTRFEIDQSDTYVILRIDWKLGNDPSRPYKRSRLIQVMIAREALEGCTDFRQAGSRFRWMIEQRLACFTPDHKTCLCGIRPTERWVISASHLT